MSVTYNITTNFGIKDDLPTNDPDKVVKGTEFTTEFTNIKSAFTLAAPAADPVFTGTASFGGNLIVDTDTLYVDAATNNVGIGTSNPFSNLSVVGATGAGYQQVKVRQTETAADQRTGIMFAENATGTQGFGIGGFGSSTANRLFVGGGANGMNAATEILFSTAASVGTNIGTTAMTIKSSGDVGIGTDSPDAPLHVNGGAIVGGDGTAPTQGWNTGLRGTTEQTTANLSTTGTTSSSLWAVESTGNAAGSGGGVLFGAREGRFAAIKGLLVSGSNNTAGDLSFSTRRVNTDATLTEAMRITASGRVGINNSSPTYTLDVTNNSTAYAPAARFVSNSDAANWARVDIENVNAAASFILYQDNAGAVGVRNDANQPIFFATNAQTRMTLDANGNLLVNNATNSNSGSAVATSAKLAVAGSNGQVSIANTGNELYFSRAGANYITANNSGAALHYTSRVHRFFINATQSMTLDSSGNLLVGAVSPINSGHTFVNTSCPGNFYRKASTSTAGIFTVYSDNVATQRLQFQVLGNGDVQSRSNSYGAVSDARLKSNIADARPQLDDIMAIKVRNFNLEQDPTEHIGVIAQELEEAGMVGLVGESDDGYKSVKYSVLYMKAIKAMQEQQEIINDLRERVSQLEGA